MDWLESTTGFLGIPPPVLTLSTTIYGLCLAGEKVVRQERLKDVADFLQNRKQGPDDTVARFLRRTFILTFGESHLSWRCLLSSIAVAILFGSTVFFPLFIFWTFNSIEEIPMILYALPNEISGSIEIAIATVFIPFYISLWKSRLLLNSALAASVNILTPALLFIADLLTSILISSSFIVPYMILLSADHQGESLAHEMSYPFARLQENIYFAFLSVIMFCGFSCALFTSIWVLIVLISSMTIRVARPLQTATIWLFDVEKHPLQAVGIVSAAILLAGSFVWKVLGL